MPRSTLVKPIPEGSRFTRWVVIGPPEWKQCGTKCRRNKVLMIPCRCDCGTESLVGPRSLRFGSSKSCGCIQVEYATGHSPSNKTHNLSNHPLHSVWCAMKSRCFNPEDSSYHYYGGTGITVCSDWMDFQSFYDWAIQHWKKGLDIDRIDNSRGYSPENCRFISRKDNLANRRNTKWIEVNGSKIPFARFVESLKLSYQTVYQRAKEGMSATEIVWDLVKHGWLKPDGSRSDRVPDAR